MINFCKLVEMTVDLPSYVEEVFFHQRFWRRGESVFLNVIPHIGLLYVDAVQIWSGYSSDNGRIERVYKIPSLNIFVIFKGCLRSLSPTLSCSYSSSSSSIPQNRVSVTVHKTRQKLNSVPFYNLYQ